MRVLITYLLGLGIFVTGFNNFPHSIFSNYIDQASLFFLILTCLGCLFLFNFKTFKTLWQTLTRQPVEPKATQRLLIHIETLWHILKNGTFTLWFISLVFVLRDITDMAQLGNFLALGLLCPIYLLPFRWLVLKPLTDSLKKKTQIYS